MKKALSFILSLSLLCMTPAFTSLAAEADLATEEVITVEAEDVETVEAEEIEEVAVTEDVIVAVETVEVDDAVAEAIEEFAAFEENEDKGAGTIKVLAYSNKAAVPLNTQVVISATVTGTPSEDITYYWQKSTDGVSWGATKLNGYNTDTLSFTSTEARLNNYYRLVVKCGGYKAYSNPVKVERAEQPVVTIVANRELAPVGTKIVIKGTVENATGNVSYKWQKSYDYVNWETTTLTGCNSDTLSFTATEARLDIYYRLVVTDENRRWYSNSVIITKIAAPSIYVNLDENELSAGDYAIFNSTILNTVGEVTYQWQKSLDGETGWTKTKLNGYDTDTLSFRVTEARANNYYRLKVKDDNGTWYSNASHIVYRPVCSGLKVSIFGFDSSVQVIEKNQNYDFDFINNAGMAIMPKFEKGFGTLSIDFAMMNEVPQFGIDQSKDYEDSFTAVFGPDGYKDSYILTADPFMNSSCDYVKVTVTLKDQNFESNHYSETIEFGIRFVKHVAVLMCNGDYNRDGDYSDKGDLSGVPNDCKVMTEVLNQLGWEVHPYLNSTAEEMKNAITESFAGTTEGDVCLCYYSGHGLGGEDWVDYFSNPNAVIDINDTSVHVTDALGALCGVGKGDDYLLLPDLAATLNNACRGKVIVLMDSCFSGAAIGVASTDEFHFIDPTLTMKAQAFNKSVVDSFENLNAKITTRNDKTGALCVEDKFYVITAAAMDQTSWDSTINGTRCGYFTYHMLYGLGATYPDGDILPLEEMYGDQNDDFRYSLSEAYEFTEAFIAVDIQTDIEDFTDDYYDLFADIYNHYYSNSLTDNESEFIYYYNVSPEGYSTLEAYWAFVLNYFTGCDQVQITCAYGDGEFILFSRLGEYVAMMLAASGN